MRTPHGHIHWTELNTWDPEKAMAFFSATLGWTFEQMTQGAESTEPYWIAKSGDAVICGIMPLASPMMDGVPSSWMTYLAHDDVDAAARTIKESGGTVMVEPFDIPGVGRMLVAHDPSGAVVGLMTPADQTMG